MRSLLGRPKNKLPVYITQVILNCVLPHPSSTPRQGNKAINGARVREVFLFFSHDYIDKDINVCYNIIHGKMGTSVSLLSFQYNVRPLYKNQEYGKSNKMLRTTFSFLPRTATILPKDISIADNDKILYKIISESYAFVGTVEFDKVFQGFEVV